MQQLENKIIFDVARGFASMLLALAAIFLGAAAFVEQQNNGPLLQMIFLSMTTFNIFLAARVIDWILDKIPPELWVSIQNVDKNIEIKEFKCNFYKWHGSYFRIQMFGGAYFAFVMMITIIATSTLYITLYRAQELGIIFSFSKLVHADTSLKFFLCTLLFIYLPYQMMTINAKGSRLIFAGGIVVILAFFAKSMAYSLFQLP